MTNKESQEFIKYKNYYDCLAKYGTKLEKDGRYCHSNYLNDVAENIYYEKGITNPVANTKALVECLSDPDINIPSEVIECNVKLDWASYIRFQQPYVGPVEVKYRGVAGSNFSAADCMKVYNDET